MSGIAKSFASSVKINDGKDAAQPDNSKIEFSEHQKAEAGRNPDVSTLPPYSPSSSPSSRADTTRGMKEDLSDFTKTLSRQFWGVASFLAPPPATPQQTEQSPSSEKLENQRSYQMEGEQLSDQKGNDQLSDPEAYEEQPTPGIRSDFAQIGGRFKTGFSKLSSNIAMSGITKIASNFLQLGADEEGSNKYEIVNAVGVTEEVIAFVSDVVMHPGTWLDFPLPDEDDFDEFDMSDAQQEHALAVEKLAPRLAALRIELCPEYMSENCFWKIYFVLLHPKLSKHDALLLSTPEVLEARAMLSLELQKRHRGKVQPSNSLSRHAEAVDMPRQQSPDMPPDLCDDTSASAPSERASTEVKLVTDSTETVKHSIQSSEEKVIDKSVVVNEKADDQFGAKHFLQDTSKIPDIKFDDDGDDWFKEETSDTIGVIGNTVPFGNDEDVSFSDLEEDDDVPTSYKKVTSEYVSPSKDSRKWVQLGTKDTIKEIEAVDENGVGSSKVAATGSSKMNAGPSSTKETDDWLNVEDIDVM